jgi:hypothetical protein
MASEQKANVTRYAGPQLDGAALANNALIPLFDDDFAGGSIGKLRQVSALIPSLPPPQQLKLNLFFFSWRLRNLFNKLRVSQFQFRRGHGLNPLVFRRATDSQKSNGQ